MHARMAPPAWLPPLNSHQHSCIDVNIQEYNIPKSSGVFVRLDVIVDFHSEDDEEMEFLFPGLAIVYTIPLDVNDPQELEASLWELILDEDLIPFPLHDCFWNEQQLHGIPTTPIWIQVSEEAELARRISDFLHLVHKKPENDGKMVVANLEIRKKVTVPAEEFASWVSWFDEQKRVDPEFESKYMNAISGPRDRSAVYREAELLMARRPAKIELLQTVTVKGGKDDEMSEEEWCSICLEGFDNSDGARLPCSHMFHKNCILRWLQGNHVCPLCRYELPVDE
ncbi:E3 ubiquitin-protein ligase RING1 [Sesamum angolense]|uniref:RING-type E3 ubiquitin transferase n=1 Tax=Sesamum angolense TaxID=2727404 RepID=A0AAE1X0J6_9LAMI|nr:E3 ubiquitin-protein ligase RING1 [Sesamum angolense]